MFFSLHELRPFLHFQIKVQRIVGILCAFSGKHHKEINYTERFVALLVRAFAHQKVQSRMRDTKGECAPAALSESPEVDHHI